MSSSKNNTPEKLSSKQKHNRESIDKTIDKEYGTINKKDLNEPTEEIQRKELNEPSVKVEHTGMPMSDELETVGKPFGTLGSVGLDGSMHPKGWASRDEINKKGKQVDNDYIKVGDVEKVIEDEEK